MISERMNEIAPRQQHCCYTVRRRAKIPERFFCGESCTEYCVLLYRSTSVIHLFYREYTWYIALYRQNVWMRRNYSCAAYVYSSRSEVAAGRERMYVYHMMHSAAFCPADDDEPPSSWAQPRSVVPCFRLYGPPLAGREVLVHECKQECSSLLLRCGTAVRALLSVRVRCGVKTRHSRRSLGENVHVQGIQQRCVRARVCECVLQNNVLPLPVRRKAPKHM